MKMLTVPPIFGSKQSVNIKEPPVLLIKSDVSAMRIQLKNIDVMLALEDSIIATVPPSKKQSFIANSPLPAPFNNKAGDAPEFVKEMPLILDSPGPAYVTVPLMIAPIADPKTEGAEGKAVKITFGGNVNDSLYVPVLTNTVPPPAAEAAATAAVIVVNSASEPAEAFGSTVN